MTNLLIILAVLFGALFVLVPLVEKYAPRSDGRDFSRIRRWIFPLMALLIVAQMLRYYFG
ncbi:hypothetical protein EZI54_06650 [Marinobacter halodurans]|uniref:DUF2818 family protein n=1 Tax=Marinobacter halodurans TaxID=2528979 RepID=A0ABY1ZRV1_9GAMM|nr:MULTISPECIES: hypothetical protein [Marinobacter]ROT98148.1 hypothetical protein EB809_15040 [Marinobacter sp. R17]TBW57707.1 hypothetical protein EZI54_06650 [Marinobacter halodurans]